MYDNHLVTLITVQLENELSFPNTPCVAYLHWGGARGVNVVGIYDSPMEPLGVAPWSFHHECRP